MVSVAKHSVGTGTVPTEISALKKEKKWPGEGKGGREEKNTHRGTQARNLLSGNKMHDL